MHIEPATEKDVHAIAHVQVLSWRHAYEGLLPRDYLASLDVGQRAAQWRGLLSVQRPQLLVARADGEVQGFIAFGPSRDSDAPAQRAEIWALYLAPWFWSRGWGRRLWLAARAQLRAQSYASASLWVLAGNARAILFYAAAGFAPEAGSARQRRIGGVAVRELRCSCRLDR